MLNILEYLCKIRHSLFRQDANLTDQSRNCTSGESAATEAEEEDLIAYFVVCCDKVVTFTDVLRKTC